MNPWDWCIVLLILKHAGIWTAPPLVFLFFYVVSAIVIFIYVSELIATWVRY